jgi:hypothetical protein
MPHRIKVKIITYSLYQIALNRTLYRQLEKWCKFSRRVTRKSRKKNSRKKETCLYVTSMKALVDLLLILNDYRKPLAEITESKKNCMLYFDFLLI